ncbi:MAG: N-ethylammeline chlorohydrolase [Coxiella sp. (in: Bacteria)]|nr:MAG: N-ethylammeline chlorohydrolase [Coxiella sp. (in: g-proteobacteria)]
MQEVTTLINARWVLPIAPQNIILEHHSIALQGDKIVDILPTADAPKKYKAKTTLDRSSHVVMPGLVNTHCHNMMVLFRGLADDLPLMDWLNNHMWPAEGDVMCANSIKDGARLGIAEMLRGGTTCYNDHYFFPLEAAEVTIEEGMRGAMGLIFMNVPNKWAKDEDEYYKKALHAVENRPDSSLITWLSAPGHPFTNSDRSLTLAKQLAEDHDLRMHMHLHEAPTELTMELEAHGKHPIQRLHDLGLLDEKFLAVHMIHLNDDEIALCAKLGVHIAHCPESNMKLASGTPQIKKYMDAGINVSLGTDGAASNNDLDMFGEMRSASFLAKLASNDPTALPAPDALKMATLNGAKALGLDDKIGSLEAGKQADIIAINMDHLFTHPIYNPMSHLIYAVNRLQVSDVWVDGKQLLDKGEFTQLDLERTIANVHKWTEKCEQYKSKACDAG